MADATRERESSAPWLRESKTEAAGPSIEKAPQLHSSLGRFADSAGQAMAELFGGAFAGTFEATEAKTTFELLAAHDGHPAALMHSAALDARLLMIMEPRVVEMVIATMFGTDPAADSVAPATEALLRPRTELESRLLGELSKSLAEALRSAFAPVATFDLGFESLFTIDDTNALGAKDAPAIATRYTIKTPGGAFRLTLIMPLSLTSPLAELFARGPADGASKLDPHWTSRMERGVKRAQMDLSAILDEFDLTLADVARFEIGSVLPLTGDGEGKVRIECVERGVFICKLGERNNRYALEVEDIIARPIEPPYPGPPL